MTLLCQTDSSILNTKVSLIEEGNGQKILWSCENIRKLKKGMEEIDPLREQAIETVRRAFERVEEEKKEEEEEETKKKKEEEEENMFSTDLFSNVDF